MDIKYLLLDMGSNRNNGNPRDPLFGTGIYEQFNKLSISKENDFEDFIRTYLIGKNLDINVSYPNFDRGSNSLGRDNYGNLFYRNVAIRIGTIIKNNDLVLMGDIVEKNNAGFTRREYIVKGILVMDPRINHYGELFQKSTVVAKLSKDDNWEGPHYSEKWPSDDHINNNLFSNDFMLKLQIQYVVKNPSDVQSTFNSWSQYLESRRYLINEDSKEGYDLESSPEITKAFITDRKVDEDGFDHINPFLISENQTWSKERIDETSKEALLLHLFIDMKYKQYTVKKERKNLKSVLDGFTRNPVAIVDPNITFNAYDGRKSNVMLQLHDGRISTSTVEKILPQNEFDELDRELKLRSSEIEHNSEELFKNKIKTKLNDFSNSELISALDSFENEQRNSVSNKISSEVKRMIVKDRSRLKFELSNLNNESKGYREKIDATNKKVTTQNSKMTDLGKKNVILLLKAGKIENLDKPSKSLYDTNHKELKKIHSEFDAEQKKLKALEQEHSAIQSKISLIEREIDALDSKYDTEPLIKKELNNLRAERHQYLIDLKKEDLDDTLRPEYNHRLKSDLHELDAEIKARKEFAEEENSIARFHLFYELEAQDTNKLDVLAEDYNSKMRPHLSLRKDYSGEMAIIDRQQTSLNNLRKGFVMNPFLATALFSPGSSGNLNTIELDEFYSEKLNDSQKEAVRKALSSNGMFLLQGPPGTGKTEVIAEITTQLVKQGKKVLIASENNKAVDNAFSRIPQIPIIRKMRLLSKNFKNNDNQNSIDALLKNFYGSVTKSLDREIDRFNNYQKYDEELENHIEDLREKIQRINSTEETIEELEKTMKEIESDLQKQYKKLEKTETSNNDLESEIEKQKVIEEGILLFTNEDFASEIMDMVKQECSIDLSSCFDYNRIMAQIHKTEDSDIVKEFLNFNSHKELFKLYSEKKNANKLNIVEINTKIHKYENDKDILMSDYFPILSMFLPSIPDKEDLRNMKDLIDEIIEDKIEALDSNINELKNSQRDSSSIKQEVKKLKDELQKCRDNPIYKDLEKKRSDFTSNLRTIFIDLHIHEYPDNPKEAIDRLALERKHINREFQNNRRDIDERLKAYRKISKYLKSEDVIENDRDKYNPRLLECVNVIGMTCSTKSSFKNEFTNDENNNIKLNTLNIDVVIIDEVSKISFIELLQPILFGKTVILVGDHKQLPPMFSEKIDEEEMEHYDSDIINPDFEEKYRRMFEDKSFFEELFEKTPESNKIMLTIQYRMHPTIMNVDNVFYNNALKAGCKESEKNHYLDIIGAHNQKILTERNHVIFVDCKGQERKESGSTSYYNEQEVEVVKRLLDLINQNCKYDRNGITLGGDVNNNNDTRLSIGVICPYADQAKRIRGKKTWKYNTFNNSQDEKFMVKTVDDFQGDERDIIILSMVRTKKEAKFLQNYHRINVAVSRARRLLIIVGNKDALSPMMVYLDGDYKPIYRDIINAIQRADGCINQDTILGGE